MLSLTVTFSADNSLWTKPHNSTYAMKQQMKTSYWNRHMIKTVDMKEQFNILVKQKKKTPIEKY